MENRLVLILDMAQQMQNCVDEDRLFDMDNLIASYAEEVGNGTACEGSRNSGECGGADYESCRFRELKKQFNVFYRLERLREEWSDVIGMAQDNLYRDEAAYLQIRKEFLKEYSHGGKYGKRWERFQENVLIFFLYTYFCGAVYDDWIYSKAALAVFSTLFISEFVMCRWHLADNNISPQECVELAYRYAREVEHSDENINFLEEWLQENPFTLKGTEH